MNEKIEAFLAFNILFNGIRSSVLKRRFFFIIILLEDLLQCERHGQE